MATPIMRAVCREHGIPAPQCEYRFHASRRWRFDFAWPDHGVALEVEGGVFVGGRHGRGPGFVRDMEKYNHAAAMGWLIIRCQPRTIHDRATMLYVKAAIASRRAA